MQIKSLFEYAAFLQEKHLSRGEFPTHFELLDYAAQEILDGYASLEEANEENMTRFNPWGFEITPAVVYTAVNYIKETPERNDLRPKISK